jgi:transposase
LLRRHYKKVVSGFKEWSQLSHAEDYLIYPENIGSYLSIDEVSLSKGELYTFVTNKEGCAKKRTLVACIKGTKSKELIEILHKIPLAKRKLVKEITLDMASTMQLAAKMAFPESRLVTDRFHVVKLVIEALQHQRIKLRWEAIEKENQTIKLAKEQGKKYTATLLENGDTPKQLLARSRYVITKTPNLWTADQKCRAEILFKHYPELHLAYKHTMEFRAIYEQNQKERARMQFLNWIEKTKTLKLENFNTAAKSIKYHLETILNFFTNRHTNANAESFNSKIKLFRANLRGVIDVKFFLFRMEKLFA